MFLKKSLQLLLMLLLPTLMFAQVTTSSISGVITNNNIGVEGVNVTLTHMPSGTVYNTITQAGGNYVLQGLRTGGPYKALFSYVGLENREFNDIVLSLGDPYRLDVKLNEDSGQDLGTVTVVGQRNNIMNSDRTGPATNITTRTITTMPTIDRSLSDFTRLTPQANGNGFAGRDGRYNNLQIDGANFNNGFGLSSNALPGGSNQPISLDAIGEVSVNIAPYDVRQTGFTGAGINAITRSGTNNVEGSVYTFIRPKSFSGLNVGDNKLNPDGRNENKIFGARIGAPIIKNKLFIFTSFETENQLSAGNNWLAARSGVDGPNVTRVQAADLEAVANYLKTNYNYDPGAYEGYANNYANKNYKALVRLDWNINTNNKFTLRFNTMEGTSDQGTNASSGPNPRSSSSRISQNSIAFENANYSFKNVVTSLTGELNTSINPALSNQLLVTYSKIQDTRSTPGSLFPMVDIWEGGSNYMTFGTELFSYQNEVINNNWSVTDNITYLIGNHTLTGGLNFDYKKFGNSYMRMGTSYYRYNNLANFLAGGKPDVFGITYPFEGQDGFATVEFATFGGYIQDKIKVTKDFTLTAGLRIDVPFFLNDALENPAIENVELLDKSGNPTHYSTANWPKSTPLFSPRLGFNWDVMGDRSLQLRGGTGIFTGNIPFVWFTNMPTNSGMIQNTFEPVGAATLAKITSFNPDPLHWVKQLPSDFPSVGGTKAPGSFALISNEFKMPSVWRSSLGADYRVPQTRLILTADLIYSKDINGVYQFNANRNPATNTLNYSGDNRSYWPGNNDEIFNASTGSIIPVLDNTDKGYSFAGTFGVTLREAAGLFGSLFYTYSNAKDITGNPGSAANSAWSNNYSINDPNEQLLGWSQFAVPHRVVGNVSYRLEYASNFASTFSLFYNGASQGRYAYTTSNDLNGDRISLDLLYIPQNVSELTFADYTQEGTTFTAAEQAAAFEELINNNKGLSNYRGKYVERNSGLMPWYNRWDFKFLQDFYINTKNNKRHTLQLSLDILNVGNLLNKDWGILKQLNLGNQFAYAPLKVVSVDANGVPTFNMNSVRQANKSYILTSDTYQNVFTSSSTWGMQLGIRYIFE